HFADRLYDSAPTAQLSRGIGKRHRRRQTQKPGQICHRRVTHGTCRSGDLAATASATRFFYQISQLANLIVEDHSQCSNCKTSNSPSSASATSAFPSP